MEISPGSARRQPIVSRVLCPCSVSRPSRSRACAVPSDSSSLSTIPSQPQASARRSSHFNASVDWFAPVCTGLSTGEARAECASTAGFSSSSLATLTDLIGLSRFVALSLLGLHRSERSERSEPWTPRGLVSGACPNLRKMAHAPLKCPQRTVPL